ncbi:MAG TPA: alginate lyase family protein [Actinocrinis sp.]|nr:alginate lyase family protein [Actinocrinis sp.]
MRRHNAFPAVFATAAALLSAALFPAAATAADTTYATAPSAATAVGCAPLRPCIPQTVVLDGPCLALTRLLVRAGVPALRQELGVLRTKADAYLTQGPRSVTDKPQLPPSGDKDDYLSQAPYWWPTQPKTADNADVQLAADGTQPLEITRTRSWHYANFNLLAPHPPGDDRPARGRRPMALHDAERGSILKSVDYPIPAATGAAAWPYPELTFQPFAAMDVLHAADDAGDRDARTAAATTPQPPGGDLWLPIPAPEQLDTVVGS